MKRLFLTLGIVCMSFFFSACGSSKSVSSKSNLASVWVNKITNTEYDAVIEIFKDGSYKYHPNGNTYVQGYNKGEYVDKGETFIFTPAIPTTRNPAEYKDGELIFRSVVGTKIIFIKK